MNHGCQTPWIAGHSGSSRSSCGSDPAVWPVRVQSDLCERRFAAMRPLHLIPGLHYTSGAVKQRTDAGTSPSLQRRRGILYCLMRRWGNIITSAEGSKVKPECCSKSPNIGVWQSWKIICPNKFQSRRHNILIIIASQWISEHRLTTFSLVRGEFSITSTPANTIGQHSFFDFFLFS